MCRAPSEIKADPLPPDIATSHTGCCHYTHAVVTTPNGLLLRALVCCRIYALNRNFKTYFRNTCPWLHIFVCSMWPVSVEERLLSAMAGGDSAGLPGPRPQQWTHNGNQRNAVEESRAALNWIVLLLDHSYRSTHLTSPSSSTQPGLPSQAQTPFQFCILIFLEFSAS